MKDRFQKSYFLTMQMQRFIKILYEQKICNFKTQNIYRNQESFKKVMDFLERNDVIKKEKIISEDGFLEVYLLTDSGELLWVDVLRDLK